jgi:hypothetical protein
MAIAHAFRFARNLDVNGAAKTFAFMLRHLFFLSLGELRAARFAARAFAFAFVQ